MTKAARQCQLGASGVQSVASILYLEVFITIACVCESDICALNMRRYGLFFSEEKSRNIKPAEMVSFSFRGWSPLFLQDARCLTVVARIPWDTWCAGNKVQSASTPIQVFNYENRRGSHRANNCYPSHPWG